MLSTIDCVIKTGAGRPGMSAVGHDDVHVARLGGEERHLSRDERGAHFFGVSAFAGAVFEQGHFEEVGAHALDLFLRRRASVEGAHDGAEATRGADGGQTRHAGADHQHLGRRHLARGGHLSGEEAPEEARCLDHGAVARDVGHRRERIHLLCARHSWHLVDGEQRRALGRNVLDQLLVLGGPDEADEGLLLLDQIGLVDAQIRVLLGGLHLQHDVGARPQLGHVGDDAGSGGLVVFVRKRRLLTGAAFDRYVEAELLQPGGTLRGRGDAALTGTHLSRDGH